MRPPELSSKVKRMTHTLKMNISWEIQKYLMNTAGGRHETYVYVVLSQNSHTVSTIRDCLNIGGDLGEDP